MAEEAVDVSSYITGEWSKPQEVVYNQRDLLLYAVGIGCGQAGPEHYDDLRFLYEQEPNFAAFPTYPFVLNQKGVTQDVDTPASSDMYLGKNRPKTSGKPKSPEARGLPIKGVKVGVDYERYCVKMKAIPSGGGKLFMRTRLYGVTQKKRGVVTEMESELYGEDGTVYYKFIGGGFAIGGYGIKDAGQTVATDITPPSRAPDWVDELKIGHQQHVIYRLSGDYNPLHIDPKFPGVKGGGFPEPILHGLCSLGHASRMVLRTCGDNDPDRFKAIKVRFSSPVLPGQTLITEMWNDDGGKIIFQTKVKETGKTVISNAFMELHPKSKL